VISFDFSSVLTCPTLNRIHSPRRSPYGWRLCRPGDHGIALAPSHRLRPSPRKPQSTNGSSWRSSPERIPAIVTRRSCQMCRRRVSHWAAQGSLGTIFPLPRRIRQSIPSRPRHELSRISRSQECRLTCADSASILLGPGLRRSGRPHRCITLSRVACPTPLFPAPPDNATTRFARPDWRSSRA